MTYHIPLIHIGYVKTGSTWLQRHLMNNQEAGFMEVATRASIVHYLIKPYILNYDPNPIKEEVNKLMRKCQENSLVPVVTHERLAGNPISGGYDGPIIADRLASLFPNGRILIVIREQRAHLRSIYNEYVNGGGSCSLAQFVCPPDGAKLPLFDFRFLEFHRLIEYYYSRFGHQNVLVLPFEFFVCKPLAFCNRISIFASAKSLTSVPYTKERISKGMLAVALERYLNFFFYRDNSNPAAPFRIPLIKKIVRIIDVATPSIINQHLRQKSDIFTAQIIGERYKESNRKTSQYTNQSLEDFDYMV